MINFFHFKRFGEGYLLTNDFGRHAFVSAGDFEDLLQGRMSAVSETGRSLASAGFIFDGSDIEFVIENAPLLRGVKGPLLTPTTLHILVVATACNLDCVYCQAHDDYGRPGMLMDAETAERAIDIAFDSPTPALTFEFQGGEPLLNYPVIRHAVEYAEQNKGQRDIRYSIVTNLTLLTDDMVDFMVEHDIGVSTSLDGPAPLHDVNRPFKGGDGSFRRLEKEVGRLRKAGVSLSAIQTTTRASLSHAREIVDAYSELGFESVFIRPLTPLGVAKARWEAVGYTPHEFGAFYREALAAILAENRKGKAMREGHASMLADKLFSANAANYMEQRSPCGASVGQLAYHVNGDVFTCDEGRMLYEMGDDSFKLGNVFECGYDDLIASTACRATCVASTLESLPGCCDCVYSPYCGVCPVINLALEGDLVAKQPGNYRCGVYSEMFDAVFDVLYNGDEADIGVLRGWHD